MNACTHCTQLAEWRYKDGWGVLACADWFSDKYEGVPLDVTSPLAADTSRRGRDFDGDANFMQWMNTRLRRLWPLEVPR